MINIEMVKFVNKTTYSYLSNSYDQVIAVKLFAIIFHRSSIVFSANSFSMIFNYFNLYTYSGKLT